MDSMVMEIATARFGPLPVEEDDVIHFPAGIVGLEECRRWVLLDNIHHDATAWLQSVDRPEIALMVTSPRRFVPEFQLRVARRELEPLALESVAAAEVLTIVAKSEGTFMLNLKAPLVIHPERRLGRQVIANGEAPIQYALGSTPTSMRRSA